VAANPPPDKNYELWVVADGSAPKSLGVVSPNDQKSVKLAWLNPSAIEKATFAVSVEPVGGSPTGAPTGVIVYTGKLVGRI
jgi:anti-sigma-K factor RskA